MNLWPSLNTLSAPCYTQKTKPDPTTAAARATPTRNINRVLLRGLSRKISLPFPAQPIPIPIERGAAGFENPRGLSASSASPSQSKRKGRGSEARCSSRSPTATSATEQQPATKQQGAVRAVPTCSLSPLSLTSRFDRCGCLPACLFFPLIWPRHRLRRSSDWRGVVRRLLSWSRDRAGSSSLCGAGESVIAVTDLVTGARASIGFSELFGVSPAVWVCPAVPP